VDQSPPACPGSPAHQGPTQLTASYRHRLPLACKQLGGQAEATGSTTASPDGSDECRRPPRSIKEVPPLWISSRSCSSSLSPSFLTGTKTLALAEPLPIARDHPERRRVAPELRSEFLLLLVKSNGLGSSQSMPASSASR
jgi:hypothetical protein